MEFETEEDAEHSLKHEHFLDGNVINCSPFQEQNKNNFEKEKKKKKDKSNNNQKQRRKHLRAPKEPIEGKETGNINFKRNLPRPKQTLTSVQEMNKLWIWRPKRERDQRQKMNIGGDFIRGARLEQSYQESFRFENTYNYRFNRDRDDWRLRNPVQVQADLVPTEHSFQTQTRRGAPDPAPGDLLEEISAPREWRSKHAGRGGSHSGSRITRPRRITSHKFENKRDEFEVGNRVAEESLKLILEGSFGL